jgi:hypothetical protein
MEENYQAATNKANPVAVTFERIGTGDLPFVTEEQFRQGVAQSAEEVRRQARREADQQWRKAIRNETRIPGIR